jgi:hypothetical protein
MPKKRAPTSAGVAWAPDIYDILVFVHELNELKTKPSSTRVPRFLVERLAGLARAADNEIFSAGIRFSLQAAHRDFPLLSTPVYRAKLLDRMGQVEQAARSLRKELQALKNPADRTILWAAKAIGAELYEIDKKTGERESKQATDTVDPLTLRLRDISALIDAISKAKTSPPYVLFAQRKGIPSGAGESGMALTRFVAHLGFSALAAGGRGWTLNKNHQSGTLIEAIENLRKFLPGNFLPPAGQHPCSTYQKILTDVRYEWNLGHFPWPKMDQK